jgi:hypothetical protein
LEGERLIGRRHAGRRLARAIERRQRVGHHRRVGLTARLDPLSDHHPQHEQHAGHQRAAKEQKENLAVVEAHLDLLAPPLHVENAGRAATLSIDVAQRRCVHDCFRSVTHAHAPSPFVTKTVRTVTPAPVGRTSITYM